MKYLHKMFNVEELKASTLRLIGAVTIFYEIHVIFIKMTGFVLNK